MGHPSSNMLGTMRSTFPLGSFMGALITIWTGDILGRPRQVLVGGSYMLVNTVQPTRAQNFLAAMLYARNLLENQERE
jgi:hypothetical protein